MFNPSKRPERPALDADGQAAGAAADSIPVSPTFTHHQQVADQVEALLDQAMALIGKLELRHPTTTKFVHGHLNVPIPFMEKAVAGMAKKAPLQGLKKFDVNFSLDTLQLNQAYRPLVDKVFNFGKNLKFTLDTRLALLGADSLQLYYLAKGLGRDADGADMLQLAEDLKRELNRQGPKKAAKPAPPAAAQAEPAAGATLQKKRKAPGEEVHADTSD